MSECSACRLTKTTEIIRFLTDAVRPIAVHSRTICAAAFRSRDFKAKTDPREHPATHYVWRTRGDSKVRSSHVANNGKIFAWDDPPETGHPGEDYGCRCTAEPYTPEITEYFNIYLQNVSDTGHAWTSLDFIKHYFFGNGQSVTVRQTGHLSSVVTEYRRIVIDNPKRLPGQIADDARKNIGQSFSDTFGRGDYDMTGIVFSIGNTTIRGEYKCHCRQTQGLLEITGSIDFELADKFRDPIDLERIQEKIVEIIDQYIIQAIDKGIVLISGIISHVFSRISWLDQTLHGYIYDRALYQLMHRDKKMAPEFAGKAYPELPGGTVYDIVDQ